MTEIARHYIPGLSFRWLTPLYDPLLRWGMSEASFKRALVQRAALNSGDRVLDLGCGTGTLTLMLKQAAPGAVVTGLDADPQMLSMASAKADRAGMEIRWDQGMAHDLPYPDGSFDVVASSLVVHHLSTADKLLAFREARRVLRPGGRFLIADFGPPTSVLTRFQAAIMRHLEHADDNLDGRLIPLLQVAGFMCATGARHTDTIFGSIWLYEADRSRGG